MKYFLLFLLLLFVLFKLIGDLTHDMPRKESYIYFIEKNKHRDFNKYLGYGIYSRGIDKNGNKIVYVSKTLNLDTFVNTGNIKFLIDTVNRIAGIDTSDLSLNLNIDTASKAALLFKSLRISSVGIDYNQNVYFSIYNFGDADLIKVGKENPAKLKKEEWVEIVPYWYMKK